MEKKEFPSEQENSKAESSMSETQKELSKMREKMFEGLRKLGKEGFVTKKTYQYVDEEDGEYFLKKEGLRDKKNNPPPIGKYQEHRHKIEGFINGHSVQADFAEYPKYAETTSREQYSLKLNGFKVPKEEAEKFAEIYGSFAYDLDKEREIIQKAQDEEEASKVQEILF